MRHFRSPCTWMALFFWLISPPHLITPVPPPPDVSTPFSPFYFRQTCAAFISFGSFLMGQNLTYYEEGVYSRQCNMSLCMRNGPPLPSYSKQCPPILNILIASRHNLRKVFKLAMRIHNFCVCAGLPLMGEEWECGNCEDLNLLWSPIVSCALFLFIKNTCN